VGCATDGSALILVFCRHLNTVIDTLHGLRARGRAMWYSNRSTDEITLQRLRRDIRHALDVFKVSFAFFRPSAYVMV
jgi:hypothetical protein